ncbi:DUF998 domain-containing protein [Blastococcus sp. TF02-09]|uniref:DUF998 domain-containing protein n=1 Tax=Blastococcus sp. TF02-09 TaxID=2250576 RepID=UPI000DE8D200|nr:DUF998 domain-containing protein [Blastococcus sp. TF02-9]RBY79071.1 DUF998 domain-containing protein [Blastococcus sp. TF02-9]
MTSSRLRWGALAWLATLQFFVVETVVQLRGDRYSRADDVISDLGETTWPGHQAMNASFVVQAALIVAGALLLLPALRGGAGRAATYLLGAAAIGTLLVGVFPADRSGTWHGTGAVLYLVGSAVGLICLAYALRPRSEALGTTVVLLGLVGAAATVFFVAEVDVLARGVTERAAAYVLPIGLALTGIALWRARSTDPAEIEEERRQRAERARERDEALEAAARRAEDRTAASGPAGTRPADDAEDHWAPVRRTD